MSQYDAYNEGRECYERGGAGICPYSDPDLQSAWWDGYTDASLAS